MPSPASRRATATLADTSRRLRRTAALAAMDRRTAAVATALNSALCSAASTRSTW
ncbi:hypothetical protein [Streptomyces sp. NPDC001816]|uniref:hypothetical protein n=1 Tax=Streptomyces sp. NPDC001816 TaxID=3364612 RepID=UPI00369AB90D